MKTVTKTRLYTACHSGDINLKYKYVEEGKGKMDEDIHARCKTHTQKI